MLRDCCPCLSVLSVTLVYCGETVGWIKMPRGTEVGLSPGDVVLGGDPAPPHGKGHSPHTFRPTLLWHGRPSQHLLSSCSNEPRSPGCPRGRSIGTTTTIIDVVIKTASFVAPWCIEIWALMAEVCISAPIGLPPAGNHHAGSDQCCQV